MLITLISLVLGFALLVFGANFLVDGACRLAARLGVPDRVAGLTIVAIGTSLPELVVSVTSGANGHASMALGNVVGSCIANLLLILGAAAVIAPIKLSKQTIRFEIPASIGTCLLLALFGNTGDVITRFEGGILLVAFAAFIVRAAIVGLREGSNEDNSEDKTVEEIDKNFSEPYLVRGPVTDCFFVIAGIVLLKVGADLAVNSSVSIADAFGVSERIIGMTVVALGTSLPELVTSVVAALRGNSDISVGNVTGSNVANLLLVIGMPALLSPIAFSTSYNIDIILVIICSLVLMSFAFIGKRNQMGRIQGLIFLGVYILYIGFSVAM